MRTATAVDPTLAAAAAVAAAKVRASAVRTAVALTAAEARAAAVDADRRITVHEQVCAVRYQGIIDRVQRLERVVISSAAALILAMGGIIGTIFFRLPGVH